MAIRTEIVTSVLDLISFVIVTPEIIGAPRVQALNDGLRKTTTWWTDFVFHDFATMEKRYQYAFFVSVSLLALQVMIGVVLYFIQWIISFIWQSSIVSEIFEQIGGIWKAVLIVNGAFFSPIILGTAWDYIVKRYQLSRALLAIGALLFFASRVLSIIHAVDHPN